MHDLAKRLLPVIRTEVSLTLLRDTRSDFRDHRQEVQDLIQEVFLSLLASHGKVLRAWDPDRGLSLNSYVRLVSRRRVTAILRSGRSSPWAGQAVAGDSLELHVIDNSLLSEQVESSDALAWVLENLDSRLNTRGKQLFRLLYVEERSVEEVMDETDMTRDAIYAWRTRFRKIAAPLNAKALAS